MKKVIAVLILAGTYLCGPAALAQDEASPVAGDAPVETKPMVDLQSLLEQVAERSGLLGE